MVFIQDNPAFIVWALLGLLSLSGALLVYIWQDHRGREREDRDGLKSVFGSAIDKLEEAIRSLNGTVKALGESVGNRIDDVEDGQSRLEVALATERQRINGVIAVCQERARHCPIFAAGEGAAHFHRRMDEQSANRFCHQRHTDNNATPDGDD